MARSESSSGDLVELLLEDHARIESLLAKTAKSPDTFSELVHAIVTHEVAEEEIVYPEFRDHGGSEAIADARLGEQREAEQVLQKMEHLDTSSADFTRMLHDLSRAVAKHAKSEESEVFASLKSTLPEKDLRDLGSLYKAARSVAPTHPHPKAPDSPPGNVVAGPVLALADRIRDAVRSLAARARA